MAEFAPGPNPVKSVTRAVQFSEETYLAWLAYADLSPEVSDHIWASFSSAQDFYMAFLKNREVRTMIPETAFIALNRTADNKFLEFLSKKLYEFGIHACTFRSAAYPGILMNYFDYPRILFYQGDPACLTQRMISMVGSRAASYQGINAAKKIAQQLSNAGVSIVSGLAYGIDTASHEGCLKGKSPTIAVMGCGLDQTYPAGNRELKKTILEQNGLFLSEYPPGVKPLAWHFPVRNRIISGISSAVVLMEAQIRSGSMTTVQHALDQGKEVFVYPGIPDSLKYEGNHQLLREGARYFTTAEDILDDRDWLDNPRVVGHNNVEFGSSVSLSAEEKSVIQILKDGDLSFEEMILRMGISPQSLMSIVTGLQIKGLLIALPGKIYSLKH